MSDRLEQVLTSISGSMDWPEPSPHLAGKVTASIGTHRRRDTGRRWIWATVTAVVVALALIPQTRQAVAELVVEAGVRIGMLEETPTTGADLDLGEEVTLEDADISAGFDVQAPAELGDPSAIFIDDDTVSMVWASSASLPAAPDTDVGVLLSQSPGGEVRATKGIGPDTEFRQVGVNGLPAIWIEGADHSFTLFDEHGESIPKTKRLAANVLLWSDNEVDYRLELTAGLDDALSIARSLEES